MAFRPPALPAVFFKKILMEEALMASSATESVQGPLNGIRVLELGQLIAAPFATKISVNSAPK